MKQLFVIMLLTGIFATLAGADARPEIRVVGLFAGRVAIEIDGQRRVLREGETSPEGIGLMQADSEQAILVVDGVERRYVLSGGRIQPARAPADRQRITLLRKANGLYETVGTINGRQVEMLIDTGASLVAIPADKAREMGIDYRLQGEKIGLSTAAGSKEGWRVKLDRVRLGELTAQDVEAVVLEGETAHAILLGMSFLERFRLNHQGDLLYLEAQ